jgi:hypothetical protein
MSDPGELLRDRLFAAMRGAADEGLIADVNAVDAGPTTTLHGLGLACSPSARRKLLRFVDAGAIDAGVRARFARPCAELPELAAVFVDPEELGYHNFENIIELGRLFRGGESARFTVLEQLANGVTRMRLKAPRALSEALARLDELGLYVRAQGPSRGGSRFIFHSAELAATLTAALREALPARMIKGFVHVNPVFRCNRFEPGDAPFAEHVDSPYHDGSLRHVSKYTLLVYLTGGCGDASLAFAGGPKIREIAGMTAFVFDQRRAHEGRPYDDGRKVFLRTELVFKDANVEYSPGVAALFARACYLGGESVFAPELAAQAHAAYDRAAAAHWRALPGEGVAEPVLHKEFRGVHFVTDGYDYWFHGLGVIECAALALLDLLNASVGGEPFRRLCSARALGRGDGAWISGFLCAQAGPPEPVFARLDKEALFPALEPPMHGMGFPGSPDFEAEPFPPDWDATRNPRVLEVHRLARRWAMRRILAAPVLMLGKEVFLDPEKFVVEGDRIHVLSRERVGPLHFAGARFFGPEDFIGVDVKLDALQPLVPPMFFHARGGLVHLRCDLFRNGWMVSTRSEVVPVPRALDGDDASPDHTPWLDAAKLDLQRLQVQAGEDEA